MNTVSEQHAELTDICRLRWQCRRGMLELDYLLRGFLEQGYAELTPTQRQTFVQLLAASDVQLSDWLLARAVPPEPQVRELVAQIIAAAQRQ